MSKNALNKLWTIFSISFLYKNWTVRFGEPEDPVFFQRNPISIFLSNLAPLSLITCSKYHKPFPTLPCQEQHVRQ
jgi:hypothetical protein